MAESTLPEADLALREEQVKSTVSESVDPVTGAVVEEKDTVATLVSEGGTTRETVKTTVKSVTTGAGRTEQRRTTTRITRTGYSSPPPEPDPNPEADPKAEADANYETLANGPDSSQPVVNGSVKQSNVPILKRLGTRARESPLGDCCRCFPCFR
ncbi:uncharacterized protein LOC141903778 [Tubulanus polymorphus]|uniref:uncharacterized protein LOC141903778 n=1 Tax=Tubulanus polymorphus TaxID=672921 RepID=UPI003DA52379